MELIIGINLGIITYYSLQILGLIMYDRFKKKMRLKDLVESFEEKMKHDSETDR